MGNHKSIRRQEHFKIKVTMNPNNTKKEEKRPEKKEMVDILLSKNWKQEVLSKPNHRH